MKILFIAPLPPPIHGQSLASEVLLRGLEKDNEIFLVDTAKKKGGGWIGSVRRFFRVGGLLKKIFSGARRADLIYLTISESVPGNLKDLLTYVLCLGKLDKTYIHLHGGAGMIRIMRGGGLLAGLNANFLKRLKGVIILGESHRAVFAGVVRPERIHVVPNFAEEDLFIPEGELPAKFDSAGNIRLLYLSNLIPGKGYEELLEAYAGLPQSLKECFTLDFAGAFHSEGHKQEFLAKVRKDSSIRYHGVIRGEEKRRLFQAAHVFCLPTYYPYEGQPISILEAYASGCIVLTTDHSGIRDVFQDPANGFEVQKRSPASIAEALARIAGNRRALVSLAAGNRRVAGENYRSSIYQASLKTLMGIK